MTESVFEGCDISLQQTLDPAFFKALCDANRLALVARLASCARPLTVSDAGSCCGVHISGTSRHLAQLKAAGIVRATKKGREVFYELDTKFLVERLRHLADALERCTDQDDCC